MNKPRACAKLYGLEKCPVIFNIIDIVLVKSSQSLLIGSIFIDNLTSCKVYFKNKVTFWWYRHLVMDIFRLLSVHGFDIVL